MNKKNIVRIAAAILSAKLLAASAIAQEAEMLTGETTVLKYGYERMLEGVTYDEAVEKVTAALQEKGFGVLTEIDVKATMKKKLDKDYPKYIILGACNPVLADRALTAETNIGLLMPCNVVVRETDSGQIAVSVMNPMLMSQVTDNPELEIIAKDAELLVKQVLEGL